MHVFRFLRHRRHILHTSPTWLQLSCLALYRVCRRPQMRHACWSRHPSREGMDKRRLPPIAGRHLRKWHRRKRPRWGDRRSALRSPWRGRPRLALSQEWADDRAARRVRSSRQSHRRWCCGRLLPVKVFTLNVQNCEHVCPWQGCGKRQSRFTGHFLGARKTRAKGDVIGLALRCDRRSGRDHL